MRQITRRLTIYSFFLACLLSLSVGPVTAQENTEGTGAKETQSTTTTTTKSTDVNVTADGDTWYTKPWVWIVGAAVFILLLVALLSSGKGKETISTSDRVTIKKTVERDSGSDINTV